MRQRKMRSKKHFPKGRYLALAMAAAVLFASQSSTLEAAKSVSQLEDETDSLEEELREKNIERLSAGTCTTAAGIIFLDILTNLERVADHAHNLAGYVKDEL